MEHKVKLTYSKPEVVELSAVITHGLMGMNAGKMGASMEEGMSGMGVS